MTPRQRKCFAKHVAHGPNHVVLATLTRAVDESVLHAVFSSLDLAHAWVQQAGGPDDEFRFNLGVIDIPEYGHLDRTDLQ